MEEKPLNQHNDVRSRDFVFIPFCLLCRGVVADGLAKEYSSVVTPVIQVLLSSNVNIVQLPCPEMHFCGFRQGLKRKPKLKSEYDTPGFRDICRKLCSQVADLMVALQEQKFNVKCILGIEYSPSCAVNYIYKCRTPFYSSGGYTVHEAGIFNEEMMCFLSKQSLEIPFVGINLRGMKKSLDNLREILSPQGPQTDKRDLF